VDTILGGEPIIKGTRTPVRAIAEHWKFGDTPEETARKLPHLHLAQIQSLVWQMAFGQATD